LKQKNYNIKLKLISTSDYAFLFSLLKERKPNENISHKKMPSYKKHIEFINSKPYFKWYIIYQNNKKIGSAYLSKQNEIGIHIKKGIIKSNIRNSCLALIIQLNPKDRYLLNTNPKNKEYIKFLENKKLTLVQQTYEILNKKTTKIKPITATKDLSV